MADDEPQYDLNSRGVNMAFQNAQTILRKSAGNIQTCKDTVVETAGAFSAIPGLKSKAADLKEAMIALAQTQQQMEAFHASLDVLKQQYHPSLDKTDFAAKVQEQMDQRAANINANNDDQMKSLLELLGEEVEEQELGDDDDDDVVIQGGGGGPPNNMCGFTGKKLDDIEDPVEDQKGYVYDREGVTISIRNRGGRVACPFPGTSHFVTLSDLKPATRLLNKRRLQQRWGAGAQAQAHVVEL